MPTPQWREKHKKRCLDCETLVHHISLRCHQCNPKLLFAGKIRTESHKKNLSNALKGRVSWHKGLTLSAEHRKKIGDAGRGRRHSEETKRKMSLAQKGKIKSPETCRKISIANSKPKPQRRGENAYQWKGGLSSLTEQIRNSFEANQWKKTCLKRDNYTCQWCKKRGGRLNVDHIKMFSRYPELRLVMNNGQTLCEECHTWKTKMDRKIYLTIKIPNYADFKTIC